jgi:IS30 family transposase
MMCKATESWPYVCPQGCRKRAFCGYPKCSYGAGDAHDAYLSRLKSSREGIGVSAKELEAMDALVTPLVKQGQSFEAIWAVHAKELPVTVRTAYNYQECGILSTANIELPRKVRIKVRKKNGEATRDRIDRTGRTFADFSALPLEEQVRVVQGDSVVGYQENEHDVLSLHIVARAFQIYLLKKHADARGTVAWLDVMERACGTREAFEDVFGILLVDRGVEFDDWEGMERSCLEPAMRRCRVFYCDPMESNQKSECERNHEQLRRLLPKARSDFDKLSVWDVAVCSSHVNSYPSAGRGGKCPFELLGDLLPQDLLDELGLERVAPDDVVLKPYLMAHAVIQ